MYANCARYAHSGATCRNDAMCAKCSKPHKASVCSETENSACANCKYSNRIFKTKYDTNHEATDSELCEILKSKVKKYIDMHDYLIKHIIPRHLGKVGNYVQKDMISKQVGLTTQAINVLNEKIAKSQNIEQYRIPLTDNENTSQSPPATRNLKISLVEISIVQNCLKLFKIVQKCVFLDVSNSFEQI